MTDNETSWIVNQPLPLLYSAKLLCLEVEQKTLNKSGQTFSLSMGWEAGPVIVAILNRLFSLKIQFLNGFI